MTRRKNTGEPENPGLLKVHDLSVSFPRADKTEKTVVNRVSFRISAGEILGVAGESGSGKSMTALAIMGLLPENARREAGVLSFSGESLIFVNRKEEERARRRLCGKEMAMIFQEPLTSLNPVLTVKTQMEEMLLLHGTLSQEERMKKMLAALCEVKLAGPEGILQQYPHELSGGMRQRVMIAMAMINKPKLLIADEPTTALDAVTEQEIVSLIRELARENHTAVLFITHNLHVLQQLADRILILKDGKIVEKGSTGELFEHPKEDYTKELIKAVVRGPKEAADEERAGRNKMPEDASGECVLDISGLSVVYRQKRGLFGTAAYKNAVSEFSMQVNKGEIFGIVGESGCGKSTLLKVIAGLLAPTAGAVTGSALSGRIQMVFQDPYTSLNPAKRVGWILEEPLRLNTKLTKEEREQEVLAMLAETELSAEIAGRYVSELSGGQRQRVAIAAALILKPELVLLDEPVSALDVTVQAQILALLLRLQKEHNLTYVFVSHDMAVVRKICDRVLVMKDGKKIECGVTEELFLSPKEGYTKKLLFLNNFIE